MERRTIPKPANRDDWLAARAPFVGASVVAALVGEHPFITLDELAATKLVETGFGGAQPENDAMRRGTFLEGAIASWWADDQGVALTDPQELYVYADTLVATLDRRIEGLPEGVEIKTTAKRVNDVERYWYWQTQAQMLCAGLERVHVVVLDPSMTLQTFVVEPNPDDQALIYGRALTFLEAIRNGEVPPDLGYRAASILHPTVEQETTELDPDTWRWCRCLAILQERIRSLEADADQLKGMVANKLGDAAAGTVDGKTVVTWRAITRHDIDAKRLRADHPDVVREYSRSTTYRQLRLKG